MHHLVANSGLTSDLGHLFAFLAPFIVIAIAIHLFEQLVQRRLARRFGWKSILFTGWLGTPIHEFSHVVMCYTFRHKIDEMALFRPDEESGRLGFVRHSFQKGNWVQEFGNLFIGIAPLIGGTLALTALMFVFYPDVTRDLFAGSSESLAAEGSWWERMSGPIQSTFFQILSWENFRTIQFWLFLYLVLCVASHMAPSRSDYVGAWKPMLFSLIAIGVAFVVLSLLGVATTITEFLSQLTRPLIGMFSLSIGLCGVVAIVIFALTSIWDIFGKKRVA